MNEEKRKVLKKRLKEEKIPQKLKPFFKTVKRLLEQRKYTYIPFMHNQQVHLYIENQEGLSFLMNLESIKRKSKPGDERELNCLLDVFYADAYIYLANRVNDPERCEHRFERSVKSKSDFYSTFQLDFDDSNKVSITTDFDEEKFLMKYKINGKDPILYQRIRHFELNETIVVCYCIACDHKRAFIISDKMPMTDEELTEYWKTDFVRRKFHVEYIHFRGTNDFYAFFGNDIAEIFTDPELIQGLLQRINAKERIYCYGLVTEKLVVLFEKMEEGKDLWPGCPSFEKFHKLLKLIYIENYLPNLSAESKKSFEDFKKNNNLKSDYEAISFYLQLSKLFLGRQLGFGLAFTPKQMPLIIDYRKSETSFEWPGMEIEDLGTFLPLGFFGAFSNMSRNKK